MPTFKELEDQGRKSESGSAGGILSDDYLNKKTPSALSPASFFKHFLLRKDIAGSYISINSYRFPFWLLDGSTFPPTNTPNVHSSRQPSCTDEWVVKNKFPPNRYLWNRLCLILASPKHKNWSIRNEFYSVSQVCNVTCTPHHVWLPSLLKSGKFSNDNQHFCCEKGHAL